MQFRTRSCLLLALGAPALAQNGDHKGEEQPPLPASLVVPPAPARSAADEARTFALEPGLRVELVASEPLVRDPVAIAFDENSRMYVAEMTGYMPDIDGTGESDPVGSIALLVDDDGDGVMDRRSTFADGLVLPRAVAVARGGLLAIVPPELLFLEDTDGDGVADVREVLDTGLGGIVSPEHAINGLLYSHENTYIGVNSTVAYRYDKGTWIKTPKASGGQWGGTKDVVGRLFFNTNSNPLRGDLYASHYAIRNPNHGSATGMNVDFVDREGYFVWPSRINPGVNRGYQEQTLRDDFTLRRFTGACGPLVYRGDVLPEEFHGNAFICEPTGNLIKRYEILEDGDGRLAARNVYEGREFFTSTDERFRPVNLADGPDGGLYIVDMYRGLLQHRLFVTSFLRAQVEERGLAAPIGLGRIWRVVPESHVPPEQSRQLGEATWAVLVDHLSDPNGFWRDTAQRLIVEEGQDSRDAHELVREAALMGEAPLGRLHASWALDGIGRVDEAFLKESFGDPDARVVHAAVRLAERFITRGKSESTPSLARLARRSGPASGWLRHQILLSLGAARTTQAEGELLALLAEDASTPETRSAVLSGLYQRELGFLERLLQDVAFDGETEGRAKFVEMLARCVTREGRSDRIERLFELAAAVAPEQGWQVGALIRGVLAGRPTGPTGEPALIRLAREPEALAVLARQAGGADSSFAELDGALAWPDRPGLPPEVLVRALTESERAQFRAGAEVYAGVCAACHQPSGLGEGGKAPALRNSKVALGSPRRLARILLHGLAGPRTIDGVEWNEEMPAYVASDAEIAAVLTYVRREWGHGADPVSDGLVEAERAASRDQKGPYGAADVEGLAEL